MTGVLKRVAMAGLAVALASCGGGDGGDGGGSSGGGVSVVPAPMPSATPLSVSLTTSSTSMTGYDDGSDVAFTVEATQSGTTTDTVVPDLIYDRTKMTVPAGIEANGNGRYTIRARTARGLATGSYSGDMTFRLCRDTNCAAVHAGTVQTVRYTLDVRMRDWGNFQRNPGHTGFVHATFVPSAFRKAWEWVPEGWSLTSVASMGPLVYTTVRNRDGTFSVHAIATDTGEQKWLYNLGRLHSSSPPSTGNGRVWMTTMTSSGEDNRITSVDGLTGEYRPPVLAFGSQWAEFLPPTTFRDGVYISAGMYGNVVYGFDTAARTGWSGNGSASTNDGIWDGEAPAVDEDYVYYYSGVALDLFDRRTGEKNRSLIDPFYQRNFYDYFGAPILTDKGLVMAYSGQRSPGTPSVLVAWSPSSGGVAWRAADTYSTTPAVGGGAVYLARNLPARLDVLREDTGAVLWSWRPPTGERFIANTIVTDTLVFVSTDKAIYAISVTDPAHPAVWSAATPGTMAITAEGTLVVANELPVDSYSGNTQPKKLVAYRLR